MVTRKTIKKIIILLSVSVALALVTNHLSPSGIALVGRWDPAKGVVTANPHAVSAGKPQEIDSVARAWEIFDGGGVLFVDARPQENYEGGHIPGAVSLPLAQFDERIASFISRYPPDQHMVIYCSGRTCEDSHDLARLLSGAGFTRMQIFIDGFPGWEAEGYPIE